MQICKIEYWWWSLKESKKFGKLNEKNWIEKKRKFSAKILSSIIIIKKKEKWRFLLHEISPSGLEEVNRRLSNKRSECNVVASLISSALASGEAS